MEVMREAAARERAGLEVLHLEVGQPATRAPAAVIEAARRALDDDRLGYTVALGHQPLRQAIAAHYADWYEQEVDPARVVVTQGASGAFVLIFIAAFAPGSRVAVTSPGYPCYRNTLMALGMDPVDVPLSEESGFRLTPDDLEAAGDLDGVMLASPSNPTGTVLLPGALAELAEYCAAEDITLISDEIYHGITFGTPAETAVGLPGDPIVVNSFSKYYSMTGWRLGWTVLPADLLTPVERLAQNLTIAPPTLAQLAAVAAFDATAELDANVARYRENRDLMVSRLPEMGLDRLAPADGAFYVWADVSHLTDDSQNLCTRWLTELGVAATPGVDFDPARGDRYVRFSYAGDREEINRALDLLAVDLA